MVLFCTASALTLAPVSAAPSAVARGDAAKWAIYAPQPHYPAAALERRTGGAGTFLLLVHVKTGIVKDVAIAQSTGDRDLDDAARGALRRWRFKPGVLPSIAVVLPHRKSGSNATEDAAITVPVRFSLRGSSR